MDTLTTRIWDLLYRLGHAESIETLAEQLGETPEAIEQAVENAWFTVHGGTVEIAYTE